MNLQKHGVPMHHLLVFGGEYHEVKILTDVRHRSIASSLQDYFQHLGVFATIVEAIDEGDNFQNVLYILLHATRFVPAGLRYIMYRTEQKQHLPSIAVSNREALEDNSLWIFEFSVQNYNLRDPDSQKKSSYLPIPLSLSKQKYRRFEFDVLFYGSLSARQSRVLDDLQSKHNVRIKVVDDFHGGNVAKIIKGARVVLILNSQKNALLETARINEALRYDKIVVSEEPTAEDKYSRTLYERAVIFTRNLDNYNEDFERHIEELATTLHYYSDPANYRKYITDRRPALASLKKYCFGRFVKALISIQAFSPTSFYKRLHPDTIYYLSLDESWQTRRDIFLKQAHLPANVRRIPGIKASPGWTGCGMSYKFAMNSAKISGLDYVTICEDDALFPPTFERDYRIILEYLSTLEKWDIFVGLIADFDNSTRIHNVETYKGLEFVTIDKFTSTVFNIYSASTYDHILSWDERNLDVITNTIDRYLQSSNLTIITTSPFLMKHMELESTLWGPVTTYPELIANSAKVFSTKLEEFKLDRLSFMSRSKEKRESSFDKS